MGGPPDTGNDNRLRVHFVPDDIVNLDGRLGLTSAPGMVTRDDARDLGTDLARLRDRYHTHLLVTLLERGQFLKDEFQELGITNLLVAAQRAGIETDWHAMPDEGVPISLEPLWTLIERLLTQVRAGRNVVVHCREDRGRSSLVVACCLTALGASVKESLEVLRKIYPGALKPASRVHTLRAFDELWRKRAMQRAQPMAISEMFGSSEGSERSLRASQSGLVPMSQAGSATLQFVGVDEDAVLAGIPPAAPLREGDLFHVMPGHGLFMGRGAECGVTITSGQLSRLHAMVAFVPVADRRLILTDLNSRNGTWCGTSEVSVQFLEVGEEFTLARAYRFRFESIG